MTTLPLKMKALAAYAAPPTDGGSVYQYTFEIIEIDTPQVSSPEDLIVQLESCPINPSDLGRFKFGGLAYRGTGNMPVQSGPGKITTAITPQIVESQRLNTTAKILGNEGSGVVVAAGETCKDLIGKKVAVKSGTSYAQYTKVNIASAVVLPNDYECDDGASVFVNPLTVCGFVQTMHSEGHKAIAHTAAGSQLGQMLLKYCKSEGIPLVNIVRKEETVALLKSLGAEYVINTSSETFKRELIDALKATECTLAFDATGGGTLASDLLECMEVALTEDKPPATYGSTTLKQVYIYGGLEWSQCTLSRKFGMRWNLSGWLMPNWYGVLGGNMAEAIGKIIPGLKTVFSTSYAKSISFNEATTLETMMEYAQQKTGGKVLIKPQQE